MTRPEFIDRINFVARELEFLKSVNNGCYGCQKFTNEKCQEFGAVPADFIPSGCAGWDWDDVPM